VFVFLLCLEEQKEASGIVKIRDLNYVVRATCDAVSLLRFHYSFERMKGMTQICFGMGDRAHGTLFAPATLVDLAPRSRFPTRATNRILVSSQEGTLLG